MTGREDLSLTDWLLVTVYFIGIYLEIPIQITASIPFPSAPAGLAGMALLFRRRDSMSSVQLSALLGVIFLYTLSCFVAPDIAFLTKRFTGLAQLTYSILIAYAVFLTVTAARRESLARFFLVFCVVLLVGCLLEQYAGLRGISDSVRQVLYERGLYTSDLRDQLLYGAVRPKFFASEPSAVTFCITLFSFAWFMLSRSRYRLIGVLALLGAAQIITPGPTSLLAMIIIGSSYLLLPDASGQIRIANRIGAFALAALLVLITVQFGSALYSARLATIENSNDPSFFFRVIGPALVGLEVLARFPLAGVGLTGEEYIRDLAMNIFVQSPQFSAAWRPIENIGQTLNNYFWLHWTYLGAVFGVVMMVAISVFMRTLGVRSIVFCWVVWAILGQASGAYVSPKTWAVLFLAAAVSKMRLTQPNYAAVPQFAQQPLVRRRSLAWRA
jgi:hypothetical protein